MPDAAQTDVGLPTPEVLIKDVGFDVDGKRILDGVSLRLNRQSFVSIVGTSGCGKTTLLNLVAGFLAPSQGQLSHQQHPIDAPHPSRVMVFQEDAVFPWYSVAGNVGYALAVAGHPRSEVAERVATLLQMVGLEDRADAWPRQLSGGQRKRVDLARALAAQPDLLLMDEPFAALDAMTKSRMQLELSRFVENLGLTVLFVTHDLEEAVLLSDRVVVMAADPGRIVAEIDIPIARPRRAEIRTTAEVQSLRKDLYGLLKRWS